MGIVLDQWFTGEANRWSGVTSTALKTMGLGDVEQWSLGVGRGLMDACRLVALPCVVVTSTTDRPDKVYEMVPPGDGKVEDGSDES